MKKKLLHSILLGLLISGCSQEEILNNQPTYSNLPIVEAGFEQAESRTYIEDGKYLRWNKDDQISFFYKSTLNLQYHFDGNTGDNAGTFSPLNQVVGTGNDLSRNYAVYPYTSTAKISEGGIITTTLPSVQSYAENSFGLGANTMVAATQSADDTFLKFKNVGGYLKLQLYGDDVTIKSITLTGNANEKLAGEAVITPAYDQAPTISMTNNATNSITLDCGEGIEIGTTAEIATAFWVVVPPTTFVNGFTITIADTNNNEMTKSTSNEIVITRNEIKPMTAFEVETAETIPNNQIWYTSNDGNVVNPYKTDVFGANITSNLYENGKGIITFDGDVTTLGDFAFNACKSLATITIPGSITTIGYAPFQNCPVLEKFIGKYASDNGRCLIKDNTIVAYANASGSSYIIPDIVKKIEDRTFWECTGLTSVTIPESVETIGQSAFAGCTNLIDVIIPNSVTKIESSAFQYCKKIISIAIPNSITAIEYYTFANCESLTNIIIPNSVSEIKRWAMAHCYNLTDINIPNSVKTIADEAFYACENLANITIPDSVIKIGKSAFGFCRKLTSVSIGSSVTEIGELTFDRCSSLKKFEGKYAADNGRCLIKDNTIIAYAEASGTTYTIPNNVTKIGASVFSDCFNLESITIPNNVVVIEEYAFFRCENITNLIIPNSVTTIGEMAFAFCDGLNTVSIGDGIEDVGDEAFTDCYSLTSVYCMAVNPPKLGTSVFFANASNRKFYVPTESFSAYKTTNGWSTYASYITSHSFL